MSPRSSSTPWWARPPTNSRTTPPRIASAPSRSPPATLLRTAMATTSGTAMESGWETDTCRGADEIGPAPLRALRCQHCLDARAPPAVSRRAARALVDLLRDRHLDLAEDVVLECGHLRRSAVGHEDARLQLLAA